MSDSTATGFYCIHILLQLAAYVVCVLIFVSVHCAKKTILVRDHAQDAAGKLGQLCCLVVNSLS